MNNIVKEYTLGFFESINILQNGDDLLNIMQEMSDISQMMLTNTDSTSMFSNELFWRSEYAGSIINEMLPHLSEFTQSFVKTVYTNRHFHHFSNIVSSIQDFYKGNKGLKIISATSLSEQDAFEAVTMFNDFFGTNFSQSDFEFDIKESIINGFVFYNNSIVIDCSSIVLVNKMKEKMMVNVF